MIGESFDYQANENKNNDGTFNKFHREKYS